MWTSVSFDASVMMGVAAAAKAPTLSSRGLGDLFGLGSGHELIELRLICLQLLLRCDNLALQLVPLNVDVAERRVELCLRAAHGSIRGLHGRLRLGQAGRGTARLQKYERRVGALLGLTSRYERRVRRGHRNVARRPVVAGGRLDV